MMAERLPRPSLVKAAPAGPVKRRQSRQADEVQDVFAIRNSRQISVTVPSSRHPSPAVDDLKPIAEASVRSASVNSKATPPLPFTSERIFPAALPSVQAALEPPHPWESVFAVITDPVGPRAGSRRPPSPRGGRRRHQPAGSRTSPPSGRPAVRVSRPARPTCGSERRCTRARR